MLETFSTKRSYAWQLLCTIQRHTPLHCKIANRRRANHFIFYLLIFSWGFPMLGVGRWHVREVSLGTCEGTFPYLVVLISLNALFFNFLFPKHLNSTHSLSHCSLSQSHRHTLSLSLSFSSRILSLGVGTNLRDFSKGGD